MIETLTWVFLALLVGSFLGMGLGGAVEQRKQQYKSLADRRKIKHEHVFDQWTEPKLEPIYEDDGQVGVLVSQHRVCMACGWIEYRRESHFNEED